jgi:hypothetical protein
MMKPFAYLVTTLAIAATFWFGIDAMEERFSASGLLILLLVSIPYLLGMWVLSRMKLVGTTLLVSVMLILLSLAGVFLIYDAFYLHPDAQSGLVFFTVPVYSFPVILLVTAIAFMMERKAKEA